MSTQTVMLELPESLYRSASQVAQAIQRPLAEILQESLAHTLPPLEDVAPEEALELAQLSNLDDAALWQVSYSMLSAADQAKLTQWLEQQREGELTPDDTHRLQALLDEYGRLLVRKAHAWLLLARRGYRVPPQQNPG